MAPSLGHALLEDLASGSTPAEIGGHLSDYGALTGYDVAFRQLIQVADGQVDLSGAQHRIAVVNWLRTWGCRHLRRAGREETAGAIGAWWDDWSPALPGTSTTVTDLDEPALQTVASAFEALRTTTVAGSIGSGAEVEVTFGDTAASKTFSVVRPLSFLPWDDATRLAFGWWGGGIDYAELLRLSADALRRVSHRLGVSPRELPGALGRAASSPAKLVDEYLWVRIAREA